MSMGEPVDEVVAAIDILIDEAESAIEDVKADLRAATDDERFGDLDHLRKKLEKTRMIVTEIDAIRTRWVDVQGDRYAQSKGEQAPGPHGPGSKRYLGRVKRGTRTPEAAFRRPVLEALVELGGSARVGQVLDIVGGKMEGKLKDVDRQPLPSNNRAVRWRNTAQWARDAMVKQGFMLPVRQVGVWEISEQGREWLRGFSGSD